MSDPRVTVLMCVHNGGRYLRAAVESVLGQTWRDFEFLILDDASSDDSAAQIEVLRDPRIRLIRLPENIGLTRSLNVGLRGARGEFIARHDADDLSAPERLERQVAFLAARPEVVAAGSEGRLMDAEGRTTGRRLLAHEPAGLRWMALFVNPFIHTAMMFRRKAVLAAGGYDESFPVCQDYDLWTRLLRGGTAANLPEPLVRVREHDESVSSTRRDAAAAAVRRVVATQLACLFPDRPVRDEELATLCAYRRTLDAAQTMEFARLFEELTERYAQRFTTGAESADFRRARAIMEADFGYRTLPVNRSLAIRLFGRALRREPSLAREVPWLRALALLVLGGRAREIYTRLGLG